MDIKKTKIIDQYLLNELSPQDRLQFETELATSTELKQEVELQKDIAEATQRAAQRDLVKKVRKGYHLNKLMKWGFISMSCIALAVFTTFSFYSSSEIGNELKSSNDDHSPVLMASNFNLKSSVNLLRGKNEQVNFPVQTNGKESSTIQARIPSALIVKRNKFWINPTVDTNLSLNNDGTILHIPSLAFVDSKGKIVRKPVTLEYQEYRDAADIAFSGIPMTYKVKDEEFNFNSSGMFSLFGSVDGNPVSVRDQKSLTIDFKLARKNPNTNFYVLQRDSTNWDFLAEIDKVPVDEEKAEWGDDSNNTEVITEQDVLDNLPELIGDTIEGELGWGVATDVPEPIEVVDGRVIHRGKHRPVIIPDNGNLAAIEPIVEDPAISKQRAKGLRSGTLLASGMDAGHTYPDIVRGLNVGRFGVYNCDQVYRIKNLVTLKPTYVDEDGKSIEDGAVVSMIDLNYNGAFSFDPKWISCSRTGDNVILLFTSSGKLYLLDRGEFKNVKIDGQKCTLKMKDVTDTIRSTHDLRVHLDL